MNNISCTELNEAKRILKHPPSYCKKSRLFFHCAREQHEL